MPNATVPDLFRQIADEARNPAAPRIPDQSELTFAELYTLAADRWDQPEHAGDPLLRLLAVLANAMSEDSERVDLDQPAAVAGKVVRPVAATYEEQLQHAAAHRVCVLFGWASSLTPECDRDKALHQAWIEWRELTGPTELTPVWDQLVSELAAKSDAGRDRVLMAIAARDPAGDLSPLTAETVSAA